MNCKRMCAVLFAFVMCLSVLVVPGGVRASSSTQAVELGAVKPDTWAAVDGLGRTLSGYNEVGDKQEDKYVGMFYWTWHNYFSSFKPRNVSQIISENPEAWNDADHPAWGGQSTLNDPYFWNEPLLGYYRNSDKYVLRKHAELLADAGVDVIFFDCSNGTLLFDDAYQMVFKEFKAAKDDGVDVPQIAFLLSLHNDDDATTQLKKLYKNFYTNERHKEKYQDLWFYWEGKPLILSRNAQLDSSDATEREIKNFFTFRRNEPTYFYRDTTFAEKTWGWCSVYPQTKYGVRADGSVEQMCVSTAQNASIHGLVAMNDYRGGVQGRGYAKGNYSYTYTYANKQITVNKDLKDAYVYGLNFQQQWDYALEVDPDIIFLTGWNEFVCQRLESWNESENGFSDNFNDEFSRDIEPTKGILKDNFYCQMVENIRRFKGVSKPETATQDKNVAKTIDINGSADQWADVGLSFNHYTGSTQKRNAGGYGGIAYKHDTMRNDIVTSKVAYDQDYIYFMVESKDNLTASSGNAWMRLLIDTDPTGASKNWEGFEYIINRRSPAGSDVTIERSMGGWNFEKVGTAKFSVKGKRLQIAVPRNILGLTDSTSLSFNFKWADNTVDPATSKDSGDILDYYLYGDVAPGGRFMFAFTTEDATYVPTPTNTPNPTDGPDLTAKPDVDGTEKSGSNTWLWFLCGGIVLVAAAVVVVLVVRKKK